MLWEDSESQVIHERSEGFGQVELKGVFILLDHFNLFPEFAQIFWQWIASEEKRLVVKATSLLVTGSPSCQTASGRIEIE